MGTRKPEKSDEMIETLNVTGAQGTRIRRDRYEAMRKALLGAIPRRKDGIPFRDLPAAVEARLPGGQLPGGGSIMWYVTTVKLDLEARELIERIPNSKPQRLRRV